MQADELAWLLDTTSRLPYRMEFSDSRSKHCATARVGDTLAVAHPNAVRTFRIRYRVRAATQPAPAEGVDQVIMRPRTGR